MSGFEVVGALAAEARFAQQGLKINATIYELYRTIRDTPESTRKQTVQFEQLIGIAMLSRATLRFRLS